MKKQTLRAWLYLLPAILFLGFFLVYPLIDVFVYSVEEAITLRPRLISEPDFTTIPMSCTTRIFYRRSKIHSFWLSSPCPYLQALHC